MLANRLHVVILNIQDCLTCVFEYLHICHKSKKKMVILKLDFEKTFNKIEHEMIIRIMRQKGFSSMWVDWVHRILK
jgi:hypothetical protein